MPPAIVKRAEIVLAELERNHTQNPSSLPNLGNETPSQGGPQLSFFQLDDPVLQQIRDEILHIDVNNLTPLEALTKLNDIQKIVKG